MRCHELTKQREVWIFNQFRHVYAVPDGSTDGRGESPDIVVHAADCRLGIEITELCHAEGLGCHGTMAAAGDRQSVLRLLREKLETRKVPPVIVSVHFNDRLMCRKGERPAFATRLADYVVSHLPRLGDVFSARSVAQPSAGDFPAEIISITVARYPSLTRTFCDAPACVAVNDLQATEVERTVAMKNSLVAAYRERCEQVWLVICINTPELATSFSLNEPAISVAVRTDFDRVFLFSVLDRHVSEIRRTR